MAFMGLEVLHLLHSDYVAKTQYPLVHVPRFEEFIHPSLDVFVGGDRDKVLLCPSGTLRDICPGWSSTVLTPPTCSSE